jgi:hypothetical protein
LSVRSFAFLEKASLDDGIPSVAWPTHAIFLSADEVTLSQIWLSEDICRVLRQMGGGFEIAAECYRSIGGRRVVMPANALEPNQQCFPVDACDHLQGQQGVASEPVS